MPPEQIKDPLNVDHRVDIWALGAILYELLTGQMAFVGENVKVVLDRVLGEDPCPITALRRDVPAQLIAAINAALARDRDSRWPTAAMFARAIAPFGTLAVVSSLPSIQREVGSLSAMPVLPTHRVPPASVEPMVSSVPREALQTQPDATELSRRHYVVQDWTAQQARKRTTRAAILFSMASMFLFAAALVVAGYRSHGFGLMRPRTPVAAQAPPPATDNAFPTPPPPAIAVATTTVDAATKPPSSSVHPAASSVHPARNQPHGAHLPK
jgi:serine/threonine-protein kinase